MNEFLYTYGKPGEHFSFKSMEENSDWTENKNIPSSFLSDKLKSRETSGYEWHHMVRHPNIGTEHVDTILDRVLHHNANMNETERFFNHADSTGILRSDHVDRILNSPKKNLFLDSTHSSLQSHHLDELVKTVPDVSLLDVVNQTNLKSHHIDHVLDRLSKLPSGDHYTNQVVSRLAISPDYELSPEHVSTMKKIGPELAVRYLERKFPTK